MRNEKIQLKILNFRALLLLSLFTILLTVPAYAQLRTFDSIFPSVGEKVKTASFSGEGYVSYNQRAKGINLLAGSSSGISPQITNIVIRKNPGYVIESINVIEIDSSNLSNLDIYNALGNIRSLKGRLYDSHSRGQPTPLFEDATRIRSDKQTNAIPDPAPALRLPASETMYIRLKDANFGNTFYRGEVAPIQNGLRYSLTNFRNMSYLVMTVIRQEQFTAQLYIEPIREGLLIYSIAGVDISDFIASRIHIESAIAKRLAVITEWAKDEIIKKANK